MPITRSLENVHKITDWTEEVNEIDNQYGYVRSQNYFAMKGTASTSITFDKNTNKITLIPASSRSSGKAVHGKDRSVVPMSLPLSYFKTADYITPEDIQDQRMPGSADDEETLANVRVTKLTDLRYSADMTDEYLRLQALKGRMKTPDGSVFADMFALFAVSQLEVDFDLGTPTTDVDLKISDLKRKITENIKTGGAVGGIDVLCDSSFFDKLITHPKIREAYLYYSNGNKQVNRDDMSTYMTWGVMDVFEHKGVRFISYDARFNMPDDTVERAFEEDEGTAFARGVRDLFRGYYGPARKLSRTNKVGVPVYVNEYTDARDEEHEMQLEMSPLYFCTAPLSLVKVFSST